MKQKIETLYLDYFNNYMTVKRFAYDLKISEAIALRIIEIGRRLNHRR